ncbi:HD domain-containing protein [Candidatus Micrarchaeota archaeon]|nr:HD domain-containing protein [Candidatus Micrarchaeota archaeon]MBU1930113.1 HD domain-containing protein [Candidatus Micrarchaeota archaeon]
MKEKKLPTQEIEKAVKERESKTEFKSHDFLHAKRVAIGAKWFAKQLGMSSHEQERAYIAGLVHDLGRPKTEKKDHTESSILLSKKLLKKFSLAEEDQRKIVELVAMHLKGEQNMQKQVVFLADKILEQMGAQVVFRRALFVQEVDDYKDWNAIDAMEYQHSVRIKKFNPSVFQEKFRKLTEYQFAWSKESLEATQKKEPWLLELIEHCTENVQKKGKTINEIIKSFNPTYSKGKKYKKEALLYITGKKFKLFERLIKK